MSRVRNEVFLAAKNGAFKKEVMRSSENFSCGTRPREALYRNKQRVRRGEGGE